MKALGKVLGNIFGTLLALALTAALGFYGYLAAKRFVVFFARLDFTVAMVTATATLALLLAAMVIAASIRRAGAQGPFPSAQAAWDYWHGNGCSEAPGPSEGKPREAS